MLKSLKEEDHRTIELVLSAYTTSLLSSPGVESEPTPPVDSSLFESVKEEIYHLLKIRPADLSPAHRAKVFQFLAREMSEVALSGVDIRSIKDRIGQRGNLRPDLYEIGFNPSFHVCEPFGVRQSHVTETIRHPDLVDESSLEFHPPVVLHLKTYNKTNERDRFSLVVVSRRVGSVIEVQSAFRVYHADVGVSTSVSPGGLLKALAETYGVTFRAGSTQAKFLLAVQIEDSPGTPWSEIVSIIGPRQLTMIHLVHDKSPILRLYTLGLVFVIDRFAYGTALRKRGVHVGDLEGPSPEPMGFLR